MCGFQAIEEWKYAHWWWVIPQPWLSPGKIALFRKNKILMELIVLINLNFWGCIIYVFNLKFTKIWTLRHISSWDLELCKGCLEIFLENWLLFHGYWQCWSHCCQYNQFYKTNGRIEIFCLCHIKTVHLSFRPPSACGVLNSLVTMTS